MIPKTPFSTPLSASAKETETRIRNIFQGPKKRPALPVLVLSVMAILLCGSLISFQVLAAPEGQDEPLNAAAIPVSLRYVSQEPQETECENEPLSLPILPNGYLAMQGWPGSPEYMAVVEWKDFLDTYDPDGSILNAASNGQIAVPQGYFAYLCYSQEMADKLDELCGKYGLKLLGEPTFMSDDGTSQLFQARVESICGGSLTGAENTLDSGYSYADGTLQFDGVCVLPERDCELSYQFCRAVKGSLNTVSLSIGSVEQYQQWEYTTQNGVPLLLAFSDTKALLIADTDSSFVVVNVLPYEGQILSQDTLEAFAEAFDFSTV